MVKGAMMNDTILFNPLLRNVEKLPDTLQKSCNSCKLLKFFANCASPYSSQNFFEIAIQ